MKTYRTNFVHKGGIKNGKSGTYKTKSLTKFHKDIHTSPKVSKAVTLEEDHAVKDWPFGLYSEVIATSKDGKFTKEFTREFAVKKRKTN